MRLPPLLAPLKLRHWLLMGCYTLLLVSAPYFYSHRRFLDLGEILAAVALLLVTLFLTLYVILDRPE
jgi:hypothetical protein